MKMMVKSQKFPYDVAVEGETVDEAIDAFRQRIGGHDETPGSGFYNIYTITNEAGEVVCEDHRYEDD